MSGRQAAGCAAGGGGGGKEKLSAIGRMILESQTLDGGGEELVQTRIVIIPGGIYLALLGVEQLAYLLCIIQARTNPVRCTEGRMHTLVGKLTSS